MDVVLVLDVEAIGKGLNLYSVSELSDRCHALNTLHVLTATQDDHTYRRQRRLKRRETAYCFIKLHRI